MGEQWRPQGELKEQELSHGDVIKVLEKIGVLVMLRFVMFLRERERERKRNSSGRGGGGGG